MMMEMVGNMKATFWGEGSAGREAGQADERKWASYFVEEGGRAQGGQPNPIDDVSRREANVNVLDVRHPWKRKIGDE